MLDGQQRITSIGRFITGRFAIHTDYGEQTFSSLPQEQQELILDTKLLVYVCTGSEKEIKEWFKTINISNIPLNDQELRNAIYSGSFVTKAKEEFSKSSDPRQNKWGCYVKGDPARQEVLKTALKWIAESKDVSIEGYMSSHRQDDDIDDLKSYFSTVIDWVSSRFPGVPQPQMRGLDWGRFYEQWGDDPYDGEKSQEEVDELFADPAVRAKKNIYEYILSGKSNTQLLDVRLFDEPTKRKVYKEQTDAAKEKGVSNCPDCALSSKESEKTKIHSFKSMEADHVTAWSKGGASTEDNCTMLCKRHNRVKGNK